MSTCPRPHRSSRLRISSSTGRRLALSSRPFCLTEDSPISWITNYRGLPYELAPDGRLLLLQQTPRPPREEEPRMASTHIRRHLDHPDRDTHTAATKELQALQDRLTEQQETNR